jgi:hypothetical protein
MRGVKWLEPLVVWLISAVLLTPTALIGVVVHDEGFIATGAMLIRRGGLPYRDFLSFYGPAQYYVAAALFTLFGEDLLVLRLLHVWWLGALAAALWVLCRQFTGASRWTAAYAVIALLALVLLITPSPAYPAIPATLFLLLAALPLIAPEPRVMAASTLIGVAGLFRWDFGVFGLVALTGAIVVTTWSRRAPVREYLRVLAHAIIPAIAMMAVCYGLFIAILSDPHVWFREIAYYSIYEFPKWRGLQFVRPAAAQVLVGIQTTDVRLVLVGLFKLAYLVVPASVAIVAGILILRESRARRSLLYLPLLALVLLQQMRVRPSFSQGFPAVTVAIPLTLYILARLHARVAMRRPLIWSTRAIVCAAMALLLLVRARATTSADLAPLDADRAHLIRVTRAQAEMYGALIRYVREQTSADDALYSGAVDHSTLVISDSLIYFLANRLPADRFVELDPGIANTVEGQREIVHELDTKRVPVIVLIAHEYREPNATATSNGVFVLDDFIRSRYEHAATFGPYTAFRRTTSHRSHRRRSLRTRRRA